MKATKDLHVAEIKVRLTDDDAALVELMARKLDIPKAVLVRNMVIRSLNAVTEAEVQHRMLTA